MTDGGVVKSSHTRVWLIDGEAGVCAPEYMACLKMGDPTYPFGDVENVECPDPGEADKFVVEDEIGSAVGRVTSTLMGRYPKQLSELLEIGRSGRRVTVLALVGGPCYDMRDFNGGWEKAVHFPFGKFTQYGIENFGALTTEERAPTNENVDLSARDMYEVGRINFEELAAATVVREIVAIDVCDNVACDAECGSDAKCGRVLAVMLGTGATPGTLPAIVYSKDGGVVVGSDNITTMFSNEVPTDAKCIGVYYVVLASTSNSYHWKRVSTILAGTASDWQEQINGFVSGGEPQAMHSVHTMLTWIVGNGGYVYKLTSVGSPVSVSDAGGATTQALRAVHASSSKYAVAVGALNAVIRTSNGGESWQAVTGPNPGIGLNTVFMHNQNVWRVGDAAGKLWLTKDAGVSWTEITLPIALSAIDDIKYSNPLVGYITGRVGGDGKMLRTHGGGVQDTWYVMPESAGAIPASDRLNSIAICKDVNVVYAAGLGANATDGIIVKAS